MSLCGQVTCCPFGMNALEAAALIGALVLPFHVLLQRQLARFAEHVRKSGVAIEDEAAIESRGEVIGSFKGRDIHAWVVYLGMKYRFDRTVPQCRDVGERELFLEPGLVYVTD